MDGVRTRGSVSGRGRRRGLRGVDGAGLARLRRGESALRVEILGDGSESSDAQPKPYDHQRKEDDLELRLPAVAAVPVVQVQVIILTYGHHQMQQLRLQQD